MTTHFLQSDGAVLNLLGERLGRHRLDHNLTQADLAAAAGVSKRTVERLEAGGSTQLSNSSAFCGLTARWTEAGF